MLVDPARPFVDAREEEEDDEGNAGAVGAVS
jgi:hypothetical protein